MSQDINSSDRELTLLLGEKCDPCGCRCHAECIAEAEPWCLCTGTYADLCDQGVPWRRHRPTYWGKPALRQPLAPSPERPTR